MQITPVSQIPPGKYSERMPATSKWLLKVMLVNSSDMGGDEIEKHVTTEIEYCANY